MNGPSQALLNARQLAARWCMSEKTLERWRMQGTGPNFLKLGGRVLYPIEQIVAHERSRTRSCTSRSVNFDDVRTSHDDHSGQVVSTC